MTSVAARSSSQSSDTGSTANFATQNISLSDTNEIILPASFAFLGSHDLPHQEDLREALIREGEEIHCQFIPVVYHQKEKRQ